MLQQGLNFSQLTPPGGQYNLYQCPALGNDDDDDDEAVTPSAGAAATRPGPSSVHVLPHGATPPATGFD